MTQPFYMDETVLPAGQANDFLCKKYIPGSVGKGTSSSPENLRSISGPTWWKEKARFSKL